MPIDLAVLPIFMLSAIALLVVPGPAVLFAVSRSLTEGRRVGVIATLGLTAGACVHVVCAVLGVTVLLQTSAFAFDALRFAGAGYLIYLGIRRLARSAPAPTDVESNGAERRLGRAFLDGFIVNVLNPKAALFVLAFLPQFADPARGAVELQLATLGAIFLMLAFLSDGLYAVLAGSLAGPLKRRRRTMARIDRFGIGTLYLGLGLAAALAGPRSSRH